MESIRRGRKKKKKKIEERGGGVGETGRKKLSKIGLIPIGV